jgi:hypothetical protein
MLRQNSTYPGVGGVHLDDELEFWVWLGEDRSGSEGALEFPERCLYLRGPVEWSGGGGESGERGCQTAVVTD